jgi:hypothetical protein
MVRIGNGKATRTAAGSCLALAPGWASPVSCWPQHLDTGARRRRPYGHGPAHAARLRGVSAYREDRRPHFRRTDPVRPRPGQSLPRHCRRRWRDATLYHAGRNHRRRVSTGPTRWRSKTIETFCTCLGRIAGDLALVFMSKGGVYLTGGIAQKIVPALLTSGFPRRIRGQGAAQRVAAAHAGLCDYPSDGGAGRPCRLRAHANPLRRRDRGRRWRA